MTLAHVLRIEFSLKSNCQPLFDKKMVYSYETLPHDMGHIITFLQWNSRIHFVKI